MPTKSRTIGDATAIVVAALIALSVSLFGWEILMAQVWHTDSVPPAAWYAFVVVACAATAIAVVCVARLKRRRYVSSLADEVATLQAQVKDAENVIDKLIETVPASVMFVDDNRKVLRANSLAKIIHGSDFSNARCLDVLGVEGDRCRYCPGCDSLATGASGTSGRELTEPKTGEIFTIESHLVNLVGNKRATLIVERVVTEQRKLQASLLHQEKMAAFGLVAAGVAHEMGNPLSSIEMHLELLEADNLDEEGKETVTTLRQETARLRRTLRELVDFARRRRDAATSVSVGEVIRDALRLIRYDRRMRDIEVVVDTSVDTPAVHMVEDHLMQVLVNLLLNALDAMPDGGRLHIDTRHVHNQVSLRIRDTGQGMTREVLSRCLEPLYTTKEPGKGTGLGLSICKDVLRAAGGELELHSTSGHGTMVVISLPEEMHEDEAVPPEVAASMKVLA